MSTTIPTPAEVLAPVMAAEVNREIRGLTYEPIDTIHAGGHVQRTKPPRSAGRCECPGCGALKAPGAIVTHEPTVGEWSDRYGCRLVHRSIYCAGCEHVVHWLERSTLKGTPTGERMSSPGIYSGIRYLRDYLLAHPEAMEVEQS